MRSWTVRTLVGVFGLVLAGCGADGAGVSPSESPSIPGVSPPLPTASASRVTVRQLEAFLEEQYGGGLDGIASAPYVPGRIRGTYSCQGGGWMRTGDAVTCLWDPVCADPAGCGGAQWPETQRLLVTVLDDAGRFVFTFLDEGTPAYHASPDDYPPGTDSCATLAAPPADRDTRFGLDYPALLHHWASLGQPTSMDPDGDGRPCEDTYPAAVISQVLASPLRAGPGPAPASLTTEDVRAHAQALLSGFFSPMRLARCSSARPAAAGSTMACDVASANVDDFSDRMYLIVLDDTGGYVVIRDPVLHGFPSLEDYPPSSACRELSQPPPAGSGSFATADPPIGLAYGIVYYRWLALGRPSSWDEDGDGRPCEDVYGPVSWFFSQRLLHP